MLKHNISVIDDDSVSILIIATKIDKIELLVEYPNIINIMETTNKIISTF